VITITWAGLAIIFSLFTAWTGFLFGVIRWFINREVANLDTRMTTNESIATGAKNAAKAAETSLSNHREEYLKFLGQLPLDYYRREDMIRFETITHAKIDALAGYVRQLECSKCPIPKAP
jgi:hypothetical protein